AANRNTPTPVFRSAKPGERGRSTWPRLSETRFECICGGSARSGYEFSQSAERCAILQFQKKQETRMRNFRHLLVAVISLSSAITGRAQSTQWIQQFGTSDNDIADGISTDGTGNIYVSGQSFPSGPPAPSSGFLDKFNESGALLWSHHF